MIFMKRNSIYGFRFDNFEITPREIIASICILAVMFIFGLVIDSKIEEARLDRNEIYNKALKIENTDIFEYGMRTNVGNAFVYGVLKAVDTVGYPEIEGEYLYIEKVTELYQMHTRQVAHTRTVNGKTQTYYTTEVYWSWDRVASEDRHSKEISFNDVVFDYSKINHPSEDYIDMVKVSSHKRYKYYGVGIEFEGTIFTNLKDGTISDKTDFYENRSVTETYEMLLAKDYSVIFWVFWIILTAIIIGIFYVIDNRWLY